MRNLIHIARLLAVCIFLSSCGAKKDPTTSSKKQVLIEESAPEKEKTPDEIAAEITAVEERLLAIYPETRQFARELGTQGRVALVSRLVEGALLEEPLQLGDPDEVHRFEQWGAEEKAYKEKGYDGRGYHPDGPPPLSWLDELLPSYDKVEIKNVNGELVSYGDTFAFRSHHQFHFRSEKDEARGEVDAEITIDWGSDGTRLIVIRWKLGKVRALTAQGAGPLLGKEVLAEVVPNRKTYDELRTCLHEEFLRGIYRHPTDLRRIAAPGFPFDHIDHITFEAGEQHPGISVVDINQDGWDDLYLMRRWGPNRLLVNQQDGTFTQEAEIYGLDVERLCSCAVFADFDNDGDEDVFIGRTLERSMLLENRDGKFHNVTHQIHGAVPPHLVSSVAAADYDGDGLLDLYIGTYYGHTQGRGEGWQDLFIAEEDREEHAKRYSETEDHFYDFVGPPNLLLRNRGRLRFEQAPENDQVKSWRATLQPTWSDWDHDGDPDLLVTNDFAPDQMFRNDPAPDGEGRQFTEVAAEIAPGAHQNFFGMGGSWGDFNEDGQLDLYLSAMFSKAGTRITGRLEGSNPRASHSVNGNILLASTPNGTWEQVSGNGEGQQAVNKVGWSWGGQFFDPDNDGYLDLYAPTGYFTPPPEYASEVDY